MDEASKRLAVRYVRIPITDVIHDALEILGVRKDGPSLAFNGPPVGEAKYLRHALEEAVLALADRHLAGQVIEWPMRFNFDDCRKYREREWRCRYVAAERAMHGAEVANE